MDQVFFLVLFAWICNGMMLIVMTMMIVNSEISAEEGIFEEEVGLGEEEG